MVLEKFSIKNKTAIVTGANQGLGQGMAISLAEAGADIIGVGPVEMSETKSIIKKNGGNFEGIIADLLTIEPIESIIEFAVKVFDKIDILVNNAGIIRREDTINFTEKDWDDVLSINLKTVFFLSQAVARRFILQGSSGKIINIASMLSFQGGIRVPSYTASKSGIVGLTRALANEWAKYNINVNAIAPGYMATDNTASLRADVEREKAIRDRIPAGRWGLPCDLDGPIVFLSSSASDYINGSTIAVDGGWLAR